jgi:LysR family transcriptional regulator (chromosome initiation inhibitor)
LRSSRIIPQTVPVLKKYKQLRIRFDIDDLENRYHKLKMGQVDFAIINKENTALEMQTKTLKTEQYVLVCTSAWKHRKLQDILSTERIIDFDAHDSMTLNYLRKYSLFDKARLDRHFVNRTDSLAMMIAQGLGYSILTKEFAEAYIKDKTLIALNGGKTYENAYLLAWYNRPEPPAYFTAILNSLS